MELPENLTLCRASIHLPGGVRAGEIITIDVNDPEMEVYLAKGYLVPTAPAAEPEAPEPEQTAAPQLESAPPEPVGTFDGGPADALA